MKVATGFVVYRSSITKGIEYLLLKASYPPYHWSPPKGHVDEGESELETAFRETEEEAGIKREDLRVIDGFKQVLEYLAWGKPKRTIYWLANHLKDTEVKLSEEHTEYTWVNLDDAIKLSNFTEMENLFRACESFLKNLEKDVNSSS